MNDLQALIFDIQRNSFVDGPGIRTTVFFKGCNLRCRWCHNPESQSFEKEILFYKDKCKSCGRCAGISVRNSDFVCPYGAKSVCGKYYSTDALLREVMKDEIFYISSGGGVTFSGGECMLQIDFLLEILKKCKENGIHTAIDTAGNVKWENFEKAMPFTDLFLFDVKMMDSSLHKQYTGVDNTLILENLAKLLSTGAKIIIRIPVIAGINDSVEELEKIKSFIKSYPSVQKIELLSYHGMGEHKYAAIGREAEKFNPPCDEKMKKLLNIFSE